MQHWCIWAVVLSGWELWLAHVPAKVVMAGVGDVYVVGFPWCARPCVVHFRGRLRRARVVERIRIAGSTSIDWAGMIERKSLVANVR